MKIKVIFFGILAEKAGKPTIEIESKGGSLEELKKDIVNEYPTLEGMKYQVSVNRDIVRTDRELHDGDEVAFLPPFAGG